MELSELQERLAKAEGASRELDGELEHTLNGRPLVSQAQTCVLTTKGKVAAWVPAYTASIDAAVGLVEKVLPGCLWKLQHNGVAQVWHMDKSISGVAERPALALCTALVKTLSEQEKTE